MAASSGTVTVLFTILVGNSLSFILDGSQTCPSDKPCFCNYDEIYCEGFHLDTFPTIRPLNVPSGHFAVNLADNSLVTIPSRAFANLILKSDSELDLFIPDNELISVAPDAFDGIADRVLFLYLDGNNLTFIPEAVGQLRNIQELSISDNPIESLSATRLSVVGQSLEKFYITLSLFKEWPHELQFLNVLKELYVTDVPDLPSNAFLGFKNSLTLLYIEKSNFSDVPRAVCTLQNLQTFALVDNGQSLITDSFFEKCPQGMIYVTKVVLSYNRLTTLPNVLTMFPVVRSLDLSYNSLTNIADVSIEPYLGLTDLNLDANYFERIPSAVAKISQLRTLSIEKNQIVSIGDNDLKRFSQLIHLNLAENPLETISGQAFTNTMKLQTLNLQGTKLRLLPGSLASLSQLQTLNLEQNPTACNCSLGAFKSWKVSQVDIIGSCESEPFEIKTFIMTRLSQCQ